MVHILPCPSLSWRKKRSSTVERMESTTRREALQDQSCYARQSLLSCHPEESTCPLRHRLMAPLLPHRHDAENGEGQFRRQSAQRKRRGSRGLGPAVPGPVRLHDTSLIWRQPTQHEQRAGSREAWTLSFTSVFYCGVLLSLGITVCWYPSLVLNVSGPRSDSWFSDAQPS